MSIELTGTSAPSSAPTKSFISIDDPCFNNEMQTAPELKSRQARELDKLGLEFKATAHDQCGKLFRLYKHVGSDHICKHVLTCQQRFCLTCAITIANYRFNGITGSIWFKRWRISNESPDRLCRVTISIPCVASAVGISKVMKSIGRKLRRMAGTGVKAPAWWVAHGIEGGILTVRLVYWGPKVDPAKFKWKWLEALVESESVAKELAELSIRWLLRPNLPRQPEDRAIQEAIFNGARQLHSMDTTSKTEEVQLFPNDSDSSNALGNNEHLEEGEQPSDTADPPSPLKKLCPMCRKIVSKVSSWASEGTPESEITWRDA
jgi:hypothetical protein